jgi:hypothetical protein
MLAISTLDFAHELFIIGNLEIEQYVYCIAYLFFWLCAHVLEQYIKV